MTLSEWNSSDVFNDLRDAKIGNERLPKTIDDYVRLRVA
jgi:hypothetical protein